MKALLALVFLSFMNVDVNAQDTVSFEYSHTFQRGQAFCPGTPQFDDWASFLDSVATLRGSGDYRFIEVSYNSETASDQKTHVFNDGTDVGGFIDDLVGLDTNIAGTPDNLMGITPGNTMEHMADNGDTWAISSGCTYTGIGVCADGAVYPRISVAINPEATFNCNANVESAIRPFIGNSSWGGSFGDTIIDPLQPAVTQSISTSGLDEVLTFKVMYVDAAPPIPVCFNDTVEVFLNGSGIYNLMRSDIDSASYDEYLNTAIPKSSNIGWGIESFSLSETTVTCDDLGINSIELTLVDSSGNDSTCTTVIRVIDNIAPQINAKNVTLFLDANGEAVTRADSLVNVVSDNCGFGISISLSDTLFTCPGTFTDSIFAEDASGNRDTAFSTVIVLDTVSPTAMGITDTLELFVDTNGMVVLDAELLDNGSDDNVDTADCGSISFSADIDTFDCSDIANNPIQLVLTVTDASNNTATTNVFVEISDTVAPVIDAQDTLTVYLDENGVVSIDSSMVDIATSDNCGVAFFDMDTTEFACISLDDTITSYISVMDINDNESIEDSVKVIIRDTIAPTLMVNSEITLHLDAMGGAALDSSMVDNGTSDNCGGFTLTLSQTAFDCAHAGDTIEVTVTASDLDETVSTSTTTIDVIVKDTIAPTLTVNEFDTVYVDASGQFAIADGSFGAMPFDICNIESLTGNIDTVKCADISNSPLTYITTATDSSNNSTMDTTMLTVMDTTRPVVNVVNITVELDSMGMAMIDSNAFDSNSTDNCGVDSFAIDIASFDCSFINADNDSAVTVTTTVWDAHGNMNTATAVARIEDNIAPTVEANDTFVYLNANGEFVIDSSFVLGSVMDNCMSSLTFDLSKDTITCADFNSVDITLSVTDALGNVGSDVATVEVRDTIDPVAVANDITIYTDSNGVATLTQSMVDMMVGNGSSDNCSYTLSVSDSIFDCSEEGLNLEVLTVTDISGNTATANFFVTVDDTISPEANTINLTVALNDNGLVTVDHNMVNDGSWDNCMDNLTFDLSQTNFDCSHLGANNVIFSVQDGNGQSDSTTVIITIEDKTLPTAISQNTTVYLDANGEVVLDVNNVNNGSIDNCGIDSMWLSMDTLDCSNLGVTPITLTVQDNDGNQNSSSAVVTVMDTMAPVVMTKNDTVQLDANGNAPVITAAMFENGSSDNCGFTAEITNNVSFDCSHIGNNTINLKYTDNEGNETMASATLTIEDNVAPVAMASNITMQIPVNGEVIITPAMVNNGSSDNCNNLSMELSQTTFNCMHLGANNVTFRVNDGNGQVDSTTIVVTIEDATLPTAISQNRTVYLDASGNAAVTVADINNGSSDNCGIDTMWISKSDFTCADLGVTPITFHVQDETGNEHSVAALVTVMDTIAPTVVTQNHTVQLDSNGNAPVITAAMFENGSSDNCGFTSEIINNMSYDCTNLGDNTVELKYTDSEGNEVMTTATLTVEDVIAPMAMAQNITVQLQANGIAEINASMIDNGSTDNCGNVTLELSNSSYTCLHVGTQNVTLKVTDESGNESLATSVVTIEDVLAPTISINPLVRSLDANGEIVLTAAEFNAGTTDNCVVQSMSINQTDFDCSHVGVNTIIFTAVDNRGNESTETTTLTIVDDSIPNVITNDITLPLNANGNAVITTSMIDNGSNDNCNFTLALSKSDFDCTDLGENTVTLTATDEHGNVSSETAVVTVVDNITPIVNTVSTYTVVLDANGQATITPEELNVSSTDNCTNTPLTYHFALGFDGNLDCSDIDGNGKPVYVFVKDGSGNTSGVKLTTVTIVDNIDPVISTNNIVRSLDASGMVTVTAADFNNNTTDACGIANMTITPSTFDCSNIGINSVTFTATDENGNTASSTAFITIEDNMNPVVSTQDITIQLTAGGTAVITASDVDNGTSDNCGLTLSINQTDFDCSNIGANTVTLTATDANGNTSTGTSTVTVEDVTAPTVLTQDLSIDLDVNGNATITTAEINNGSSDVCSATLTYALDNSTFDCSNIGANTVTLTVTDASGNSAMETAVVTVSDVTAPMVVANDVTVNLDASGNATITVADVDPTNASSDACGIDTKVLSQTAFDCSHIGSNNVTLTVTDNNGNSSDKVIFVTVKDVTAPFINVAPGGGSGSVEISQCEAEAGYTYAIPTATDNCGASDVTVSLVSGIASGGVFPVGNTTVVYEAVDASGNSSTRSFVVKVIALEGPSDLPTDLNVCDDLTEISLGTDATFTGTGVNGNSFNPSVAGAGTHVLTWSLTENGCPMSGSVTFIVNQSFTPVIEQISSNTLKVQGSNFSTYQWYKNGNMISGANSQTLNITTAGDYQVTAGTINGCSSTSLVFDIGGGNYGSVKGYDISETTLYPNPSTGLVHVDLGATLETVSIEVFDVRGAKVKVFNFENMTTSTVEIELGDLPSAVYHAVISSDIQVTTKKIVINK
ncbi:MAG: HYR domain-containing protein [Flavobacteriales bacterium]